jgi:hypothetical protein
VTKIVRTKTVTKRKTITAKNRLVQARGIKKNEDPVGEELERSAQTPPDSSHALFARHICPRCPAGSAIGKTGGARVVFCCKTRKTITVRRTRTKMVTRTITSAPVRLSGDCGGRRLASLLIDRPTRFGLSESYDQGRFILRFVSQLEQMRLYAFSRMFRLAVNRQ